MRANHNIRITTREHQDLLVSPDITYCNRDFTNVSGPVRHRCLKHLKNTVNKFNAQL